MTPDSTPAFHVGALPVFGSRILAPMDGYSSWPFRSLCRELGSALSYTEFVRAEDILERPDSTTSQLYFEEDERPIIFQIYGHRQQTLLEAALRLQERQPDGIDINLGCPNRSIVNRGAGAGLHRTPLQVARIFRLLSSRLEVPLTAKIRLGWKDCLNYRLIARIIAENGGDLIALHARVVEDRHQGEPDLAAISETVQSVPIPVLGNGGIKTTADIEKMTSTTGCQGVMIGRGAARNPWLFSGRDREEVPPPEVENHMREHLERSLEFYGKKRGLILFRKHAAAYLEPYSPDPDQRRKLLTRDDPGDFKALLMDIFQEIKANQN